MVLYIYICIYLWCQCMWPSSFNMAQDSKTFRKTSFCDVARWRGQKAMMSPRRPARWIHPATTERRLPWWRCFESCESHQAELQKLVEGTGAAIGRVWLHTPYQIMYEVMILGYIMCLSSVSGLGCFGKSTGSPWLLTFQIQISGVFLRQNFPYIHVQVPR